MKKSLLLLVVIILVAGTAYAAKDPGAMAETAIQSFADGCEQELTTFCKDVTPGDGRLIACIYAHEDKLSSKCEYALYDSAIQLERAVSALGYVVNECSDDIETLCPGVEAGEGRILACLEKNEAKVSARCTGALKEVNLKK